MPASNRLGRYHLGERLGEGGMAEVFRAEMLGAAGFVKAVAIKRVRPALAADEHVMAAFLQEAEVARHLDHGAIVQIHDVGIEDGVPYLVIELVDGVSLERILTDLARRPAGQRRLDLASALHVVEHVAAALHYAHQLVARDGQPTPVVHRDVNPRNILISREGVVKLADFGIAKAWHLPAQTLPGTIKGTLGYLSPEQAGGAPVDARTDQFSLGVVLYELVAGENPLAHADSLHGYCRLLEQGLPRLAAPVDETLADIVARAVAVRPGHRYPSLDELRAELEAWRVARGIRASAAGLRQTVRSLLGETATAGSPVALGQAVQARLAARAPDHAHTRAATRRDRAPRPNTHGPVERRSRRLAVILLAAAVALALAWAGLQGRSHGTTGPVTALPAQAPRATASASGPAHAVADAGAPALPSLPVATVAAPPARARPRIRSPKEPTASSTGRLKINLLPYAHVTVDGRAHGQTPVVLELPAGPHRVILDNPDTGQRQERAIRVASGETFVINQW